jgi:hypothetical protein
MGATRSYFRHHRWQRRVLTVLLTVVLASVGAMLAAPYVLDYLLARQLRGDEPAVRQEAILQAVARIIASPPSLGRLNEPLQAALSKNLAGDDPNARKQTFLLAIRLAAARPDDFAAVSEALRARILQDAGSEDPNARPEGIRWAAESARRCPRALQWLNESLRTDSDVLFTSLVAALRWLNQFDTPQRDPVQIDRMGAIDLERTRWPGDPNVQVDTRENLVWDAVFSGRDNPYVRRALALAATDPSPRVRRTAATLAGRLGDDRTLQNLLADADGAVVGSAAMVAGLAGKTAMVEAIRKALDRGDREALTGAAYALALLRPAQESARLGQLLRSADGDLRNRLLLVATILNDDNARREVLAIIESSRRTGTPPPAMALVAAGRLGIKEAQPDARRVLAEASRKAADLTEAHVLGALEAAGRLGMDVRREVFDYCNQRWQTRLTLSMAAAADLLGEQLKSPGPPEPNAPSLGDCVQLLRRAAMYEEDPASQPASLPAAPLTTPIPSAAAAVALWRLGTDLSADFLRGAVGYQPPVAGDLVAYRLGKTALEEAFNLGMVMLPPPLDPRLPPESQPARVYNKNELAAGAMLLALAARNPQQKSQAVQRITARIAATGKTETFAVRGSYSCALLILGDDALRQEVRELLGMPEFSVRRAMTALLARGDDYPLDWLLRQSRLSPPEVDLVLSALGVSEVLADAVPGLPRVDGSVPEDVRFWQIEVLRSSYALRRGNLRIHLRWQP